MKAGCQILKRNFLGFLHDFNSRALLDAFMFMLLHSNTIGQIQLHSQ